MSMRRLPVYFLLDCSESMIGPAVNSVQSGVEMMIRELRRDPQALETAYISLITFDREARQILPLTELVDVQVPALKVGPGTSLGAGLKLLKDCIEREARRTTSDRKGDYRPLVFLLTDGQPTDDWESAARELADASANRVANMYAIGCGEDVDFDLLQRVSDIVFRLDEMTAEKMNKLFVWLTASVRTASVSTGSESPADRLDLTKLPSSVSRVEPGSYSRPSGPPRQVFVEAVCSKTARHYVMRYGYDPGSGCYVPTASHPLEQGSASSGLELPPLEASQLDGVPACCHCNSSGAGACGCGTVMCISVPPPETVVCPGCKQSIRLSVGHSDFKIQQSAG